MFAGNPPGWFFWGGHNTLSVRNVNGRTVRVQAMKNRIEEATKNLNVVLPDSTFERLYRICDHIAELHGGLSCNLPKAIQYLIDHFPLEQTDKRQPRRSKTLNGGRS